MSQCFGVKIILDDKNNPVAADSDVGLYNVANENSEFKWIQNAITGLSGWKEGMIIQNGLERFSISIDLRNGGNTSSPGSGSVTIKDNNKFQDILSSKGINLQGLKLEIWYFNYDGGNTTSTRIRTYICCEPSYTNKDYKIPFKGGQEKRRANILNVISTLQYPYASNDTIGKVIPATFGKLIPLIDDNTEKIVRSSFAKFIRTYDKVESKYYNDSFFTGSEYTDTVSFPVITLPIVPNVYEFETRGTILTYPIAIYPVDTYVKIVDGTGKDQIREVTEFHIYSDRVSFIVNDYFETELLNADSGDGRSWIQFFKIFRRYDCDHWPCVGFRDSNGNQLTNGAEIYTHTDEDGFSRIAPYGYEFNGVNEAKNQIEIDPKLFDQGDIDSQNSYMILPVENLRAGNDADLTNWGLPLLLKLAYDGLYAADAPDSITSNTLSNIPYATDKDINTYFSFLTEVHQDTGSFDIEKVLYFELPEIPKGFTFSECYLAIKTNIIFSQTPSALAGHSLALRIRKFKYSRLDITLHGLHIPSLTCDHIIDDIPDFYYLTNPNTGCENFFRIVNTSDLTSGYNNSTILFKLNIADIDSYNTYMQCMLIESFAGDAGSEFALEFSDELRINEIAIMFKKESDIKSNIYTPFHGRNFASTWEGIKTASDLIEKPIDIFEHVCRLQNYQDTCPTSISGWGLQYAIEPLIATSGYGSLYDPDLITVRNYYASCQITEYDKGYTDEVKFKLCKDFVIANWQDNDGKERAIALPESKLSSVYTITLDDILDRNSVKINELPQESIYSEPFVKYDKNSATDEYESIMQIKNTSASVYVSDYVVGIRDNTDKIDLWNSCHSLAMKCHQLNKPPSSVTDLQWANGQGSYTIALNYLKSWIKSQFYSEIEFQTHFNIAGSWGECTPFNVVFSQQTNNISRSCLVEECSINPNPPYDEMIRGIMYA